MYPLYNGIDRDFSRSAPDIAYFKMTEKESNVYENMSNIVLNGHRMVKIFCCLDEG